jgi:hypothetical protein
MTDLIPALSKVRDDLWRQSVTEDGNVSWLPLWLISSSGLWIGIDRDARWVVGRLPGQASVFECRLSPGWLPLLDHDEPEAREEISHQSAKYDLPADQLLVSLPVDDIIVIALSTNNPHWIDRALVWLESRKIRNDISALLLSVASSRSAGQSARQRAKRLMKRASEGSTGSSADNSIRS